MKKRSKITISIRLLALVKPLAGVMALAVLLGLAGHLCAAFITILGGYALLNLLNFSIPAVLPEVFAMLALFALLRGFMHYAEQYCNHYIAFKLLALIRDKVFLALRKLTPAKLEGKDRGDLISVITADIELLEVFYAHTISPVAIAFFMTVIMSLFIGSYHVFLGLLSGLAYLIIGVVIPVYTSRKSGSDGLKYRTEYSRLSSYILDSLRGLSEIIQYQAGEKRLSEMEQRTDLLGKDDERMKGTARMNTAITGSVILLCDFSMLLLSAFLYEQGRVGFDGVLIPVIALMSSFGPVVALSGLGGTLQNTFAAGSRVFDIMDETPAVEEVTDGLTTGFEGAKAESVTFSYGNEIILNNISVPIPLHGTVLITGKSGSGKSTLLRLFMRFWDVQKGKITISGTDIRNINTASLRDMQGFMTQETHLFHDSIENNIRLAKLTATRKEIEEACKKASVHEFIMSLPRGYDTAVGELGDTLSGGERQRIGLARAFLHNAPFMLLDEPTSNLDSLNEAVILKALAAEKDKKSIILVSHRKSALYLADSVYEVKE